MEQKPAAGHGAWSRVVLLSLLVITGVAGWLFRDHLTLEDIARHETTIRSVHAEHPALVLGAAFLLYVAVTGLMVPVATVLTLAYGWFFGLWRAILLVSFASTTGATLSFLLSRYLFRGAIQSRFGARLEAFNRDLGREGPFYLFTLRLIPAVPFFVINAVMGLTPMRVATFWWVSQLGMLPATIAYVYAGSTVPDLNTLGEKGVSGLLSPQLIFAFAAIGLFPLVVKKAIARWRPKPT